MIRLQQGSVLIQTKGLTAMLAVLSHRASVSMLALNVNMHPCNVGIIIYAFKEVRIKILLPAVLKCTPGAFTSASLSGVVTCAAELRRRCQ